VAFIEFEHKFLISEAEEPVLLAKLGQLKAERKYVVDVHDAYYTLALQPQVVLRHRWDEQIHQLTLKSLEDDSERRVEVNLNLAMSAPEAQAAIEAFFGAFGIGQRVVVTKRVHAHYLTDCEVTYYVAECGPRQVRCLEFEVIGHQDQEQSRQILAKYEAKLGYQADQRCSESLFQLLVSPCY
jgi:adenylate cyclase class IV